MRKSAVNPLLFSGGDTMTQATVPQSDVTTLLGEARTGKPDALNKLVTLVYDELRRLAAGLMRHERPDHTLQPTGLVHEAVARLLGSDMTHLAQDRRLFLGAAVRAMRQVLVDHARRRAADKRVEGRPRQPFDETLQAFEQHNLDVLAVHEVLNQLATLHERQARIIELRFFGGFTVPEVAELLDVSVSLVESDFRKASAFLRSRLAEGDAR
jgi:RNA polymerase sigma-70 factor (ECF subfamily)